MKNQIIIICLLSLALLVITGAIFTMSRENQITNNIEDLKEQGYSQFWAEHKTLVELNIIPVDSIYLMIQED